jgi:hypothetical protein
MHVKVSLDDLSALDIQSCFSLPALLRCNSRETRHPKYLSFSSHYLCPLVFYSLLCTFAIIIALNSHTIFSPTPVNTRRPSIGVLNTYKAMYKNSKKLPACTLATVTEKLT